MIISAGACIVEKEKNGKFLLVKEGREEFHGKWNLPCGELESGENILDCAIREGKEETGYELKVIGWVGQYTELKWPLFGGHDLIVNVFYSKIIGGEKTVPPDLLDVAWFSLEEIREMAKREGLVHPYVLDAITAYRHRNYIHVSWLSPEQISGMGKQEVLSYPRIPKSFALKPK